MIEISNCEAEGMNENSQVHSAEVLLKEFKTDFHIIIKTNVRIFDEVRDERLSRG